MLDADFLGGLQAQCNENRVFISSQIEPFQVSNDTSSHCSTILQVQNLLKLSSGENHTTGDGAMSQMSLAYSRMVLSLLNVKEPAVFMIDILVHFCNKSAGCGLSVKQ